MPTLRFNQEFLDSGIKSCHQVIGQLQDLNNSTKEATTLITMNLCGSSTTARNFSSHLTEIFQLLSNNTTKLNSHLMQIAEHAHNTGNQITSVDNISSKSLQPDSSNTVTSL